MTLSHVAVTTVHCVNCGAKTSWPTWVALAFGGLGTFTAARGLLIQSAEHRRLKDELSKRADFGITITPVGQELAHVDGDSADLKIRATSLNLRFEIGLTNTGSRAATHVSVNFLTAVPRGGEFYWSGPNGEQLEHGTGPATTPEPLGPPGPAVRWLSQDIYRVATRTPRVLFATLGFDLPPDGHVDVHLRAKVQSDDLPDDVPERIKNFVVHISPA